MGVFRIESVDESGESIGVEKATNLRSAKKIAERLLKKANSVWIQKLKEDDCGWPQYELIKYKGDSRYKKRTGLWE